MGPATWNNDQITLDPAEQTGKVPSEAAMILSALEVGKQPTADRRAARRLPFRVTAVMRLFVDTATTPGRVVYTRDVNRRSLGFVTRHRLPLGYGGQLEIPAGEGRIQTVHCTLLRCREAAPGWFEGSVYFNREQPQFEELR